MILWSGGCDSTLVLHDALVEARCCAEKHAWSWPVVTLAIAQDGVAANAENRAARVRIRRELRSRGFAWRHLEVTVGVDGGEVLFFGGGVCQPQLWVSLAHSYLGSSEDLITGWHSGDHVWEYIASIRTAFDALQSVGGKKGKIVTPLSYDTKAQIIERLRAADLYDLTWWCERPTDGAKCNGRAACLPCRTHALALHELEIFDKKEKP